MTLTTGYKPNVFQGNGIIKEFAYNFNPISIQYLKVYFEEEGKWVEQTSGWHATVNSLSSYDLDSMNIDTLPESERFSTFGGLVTFDEPPTSRIQIARSITEEQPTSFKTSSGFNAKVVETSLDKLTGMIQQLQEASDRSVKVTVGDNQTPEELLEEVYSKLDSATEIAEDAIEAANQAQVAADNATQAVESAEETLREVTAYVDSAKIEIKDTKDTAIEEVTIKVTDAKADINSTVVTAQADIISTKDTAIDAVESAVADLGQTVTQAKADIENTKTTAETTITNTVNQGKAEIQGFIAESETEIRQIAREEAQEAIADAKQDIQDYADTTIKPSLQTYVDSASASEQIATQSADSAVESATQANASASQALSSATTAEEWARYAEEKGHPNWGYIGGDIENQADLMQKFDAVDDKIKEIELFKFPNAVIIGEPTIQNGQVSNFSVVSYLQFPFILDLHEKAFQIDMCFTTATNVQTQQNILDSRFGLALAVKDGKGLMAISSNGTNWDIGSVAGTQTLQSNTTYYARLIWNRLQYKTQLSTDGVNYVDDMVIVDTRRPFPTTIFIGGCDTVETGHTGHPFLGTINMNKCSLSVMGNVIWQGMDDAGLSTRADISLSNLDELGEARFTNILDETGSELDYTGSSLSLMNAKGDILSSVMIKSTPDLDNSTISLNASDELQAIGVIEKNKGLAKYDWVGTLEEYETQNVETLHPDWICYITDDVSGGASVYTKDEVNGLLNRKQNTLIAGTNITITDNTISASDVNMVDIVDALYPVGSCYIGTGDVCPISLIKGTWTLQSSGIVTSVNTNVPIKGDGMSLGLTNGTQNYTIAFQQYADNHRAVMSTNYGKPQGSSVARAGSGFTTYGVTTDATKSGIVGTVTRSILTVNIWKRTA